MLYRVTKAEQISKMVLVSLITDNLSSAILHIAGTTAVVLAVEDLRGALHLSRWLLTDKKTQRGWVS